jgi:glycosyltransferase involved in cell wall biosynthesis
MKVTVSLITYNHAPFIAQAIESVLAQQASFDFELLIGEDDSTDGTRQIVSQYQAQYPDRIRLLLNERKKVVYVNGKATGKWNFTNNIRNSRGEYIALLDGDDYWTSAFKLQKQVDFLDRNRDCALCFHNVRILDEADPECQEPRHAQPMRAKYGIEDLLRGNFMHTCSVMFRSRLFEDFPPWFFKCTLGDWPLHILNAQHGSIGYLDEVMAVYRRHGKGVWSRQSRVQVLANSIQCADVMRAELSPRYARYLDDAVINWHKEAIQLCVSGGNLNQAGTLAAAYLKRFPFRRHTPRVRLLSLIARARFSKARPPTLSPR